MLATVSEIFHSGLPYILVSVTFIVATGYGLYLLKDIRDILKK